MVPLIEKSATQTREPERVRKPHPASGGREEAGDINAKAAGAASLGQHQRGCRGRSDLVPLAVPWEGHADLVASLAEELAGKIVISCVNPLGFDSDGPFGLVLAESAAQETQRLVPTARVVGAFHHVAALCLHTRCARGRGRLDARGGGDSGDRRAGAFRGTCALKYPIRR